MSKFKVGDRVLILDRLKGYIEYVSVSKYEDSLTSHYVVRESESNVYIKLYEDDELELIPEPAVPISELTKIQDKLRYNVDSVAGRSSEIQAAMMFRIITETHNIINGIINKYENQE